MFAQTSQQTMPGQAYCSATRNYMALRQHYEPFAICEITLPHTPPLVLIPRTRKPRKHETIS